MAIIGEFTLVVSAFFVVISCFFVVVSYRNMIDLKSLFVFCVSVIYQVSAEAGCRLCVRGLQPNQEYVFAVAGYTKGGKPLASGIGTTSRPYLAAHSLPIDTAWGYCCQVSLGCCFFVVVLFFFLGGGGASKEGILGRG